jgi:hypothetical protein
VLPTAWASENTRLLRGWVNKGKKRTGGPTRTPALLEEANGGPVASEGPATIIGTPRTRRLAHRQTPGSAEEAR